MWKRCQARVEILSHWEWREVNGVMRRGWPMMEDLMIGNLDELESMKAARVLLCAMVAFLCPFAFLLQECPRRQAPRRL
jgi:hypothetical protein